MTDQRIEGVATELKGKAQNGLGRLTAMWLESLLAYLHLLAILSWVVFLSSTAALARVEWLNGAALLRLVTVDRVAHAAV